jgi:hypothetical protein
LPEKRKVAGSMMTVQRLHHRDPWQHRIIAIVAIMVALAVMAG